MRSLVDHENGLVSREIFVSDEIYQQELEQIFARTWLFIGHTSQIPTRTTSSSRAWERSL